jgi:adenylosuccinate lyase
MRETGTPKNDLLQRLAADSRIPLSLPQLEALLQDRPQFSGNAEIQTQIFVNEIEKIIANIPEAREIQPTPML